MQAPSVRAPGSCPLIEQHEEVFESLLDWCSLGLKHPTSGLPVKTPTWFWTNSVRLATALNSKCSCGSVPHENLSSWSWDSVATNLTARITHGLRLALRDVEPERLEALQVALTHQIRRRRLQTPTPMIELREKLGWSPSRDHGVNKVIDEGTSVPQDGI